MNPWRAWLLAIRPRTLTVSIAPVMAGTGLALADGVAVPDVAGFAMVGAMLIQIVANLVNDYFDFVKGADTEARVGPVRVVQAGLLTPEKVLLAVCWFLVLAFFAGGYLLAAAGWPVAVIGAASLLCAFAYTAGPFPLAYLGLGDAFVFVFFGPVAVVGTYYVQALSTSPDALLAGIGLGTFSMAVLGANNLRDRETDAAAGKHTVAVRLGPFPAAVQYAICLLLAAIVPVIGVAWFAWPAWTLVSLAGVAGCVPATAVVLRFARAAQAGGVDLEDAASAPGPEALIPVLGRTARGVGLYGAGLGAGFVAGAW